MPDITSWRTPSRSESNGHCVEVAGWRTSARSLGNGECIETGNGPGAVAVRDSKDPGGPVLTFTPGEWREFLGRCDPR